MRLSPPTRSPAGTLPVAMSACKAEAGETVPCEAEAGESVPCKAEAGESVLCEAEVGRTWPGER